MGAANARYGGGGQRRSLPILDPIDDPAHGPMPVHPADLEPFVQQEILFDRGPREIDEPRVIEEEFLRLEAAGLEAPEVPLEVPSSIPRPSTEAPSTVPFYETCPTPDAPRSIVDPPLTAPSYRDDADHYAYRPVDAPQARLIVVLHGAGGTAFGMRAVSQVFAKAGFRTLALTWNDFPRRTATARDHCLDEAGFALSDSASNGVPWSNATPDDDVALNQCLVDTRESKAHDPDSGVIPQLVAALQYLQSTDPMGEWTRFLLQTQLPTGGLGPLVPDWRNIVQAGYSEGANQTSYMLRNHPYFGAILISGGGDSGVVDRTVPGAPLADWMYPAQPDHQHYVGLWDEGEAFDFQLGWTVSGVRSETEDVVEDATNYGPYLGAHRLRNRCADFAPSGECTEREAHASTVQPSREVEHMYLACKAGA